MNKSYYYLAVTLFLSLTLLSVQLIPFAFDDAYIHFRIAENFALYQQPYFNLGEQVMATSSPLWAFLLAGLSGLGLPLPLTVAFLNALLTIVGAMVWMRCLIMLIPSTPRWLATIFLFSYTGILIPSSVGLMEAPLAMLLIGASIIFLSTDRTKGWVFFVLAVFTRLEVMTLVPFFVLAVVSKNRVNITRQMLVLVGSFVVLTSITLATFGTLIPHSAIAKQIVYDLPIHNVFNRVMHSLLPQWKFNEFMASTLIWLLIMIVLVSFSLIKASVGWKSLVYHRTFVWLASVGAAGVTIATAYILKHLFVFDWYVPLYAIPITFLVFGIAASCISILRGPLSLFFIAPLLIIPLLLVPSTNLYKFTKGAFVAEYLPRKAPGARVQRYLEVGSILYHLYPGARLMTSEIGGLGYAFRGQILDGVGLITPGALEYHPLQVGLQRTHSAIGAIPAAFVYAERPELIVSYPIFVEEFERSSYSPLYKKISVPAFSNDYRTQINESGIWGSDNLYIYVRNDLADQSKIAVIKDKLAGTDE